MKEYIEQLSELGQLALERNEDARRHCTPWDLKSNYIYSLSVNFALGELVAHVSVGLWRLLVDPKAVTTTFTLQVEGHGSSDWASLSGIYKNVQLDAILERGSVEDYLENNVPGFNRKDYESVALEDLYKMYLREG